MKNVDISQESVEKCRVNHTQRSALSRTERKINAKEGHNSVLKDLHDKKHDVGLKPKSVPHRVRDEPIFFLCRDF